MDQIKQTGITQQEVNSKTPLETQKETEEDKSVFGSGLLDAGAKVGELVKENGFGALFALGGLPLAVGVLRGEEIKEEIQKDIDALKEKPALGLGTLLLGAGALTLASEVSEFFDGTIDKAKDFFDGDKKLEEDG